MPQRKPSSDDQLTAAPQMPEAAVSDRRVPDNERCEQDPLVVEDAYATIDSGSHGFALPESGPPVRKVRYQALVRGDQIGDFRIQRMLGRGSFGAVYLARELSLDRLVALKVVLPEGQHATVGEGRSLARLQHPAIVGVFGEARDRQSECSLLWMQFVDGCDLASLIGRLHQQPNSNWNEGELLRLLNPEGDPEHRPGARSRVEVVCRIGARLAAALAHAHERGITHRDIKPANILMQTDGSPLLADFNLAANRSNAATETSAGGTVAYMPPEQLAQLLGEPIEVDGPRADIYALGVVLWELAGGQRPFASRESQIESSGLQSLVDCLQIRRGDPPNATEEIPLGLAIVLRRAMMPTAADRYPSATALATALTGLADLERARQSAPLGMASIGWIRRNLFWAVLIGGVLPHFAASVLQSAYNQIWIGSSAAFPKAFIAYNVVVYPVCVGWLAWNLYRFASGYRCLVRQPMARSRVRRLRGRLLRLPRQFMIAAAVGWFPGVVLFPWLLSAFGDPPTARDSFHYGISFAIAGLIAMTYSYAIVMYVVICCGYRTCWQTASRYRERSRYELAGVSSHIRWLSILAGVLPLAAAVLLLAIGMPAMDSMNHQHHEQMRGLHRLLIALIVSGAIGLYVVELGSAKLIRVVRALTD